MYACPRTPLNIRASEKENEVGATAFFPRMQPFRTHLMITAWEQTVLLAQHGTGSRCTILALVGESCQGKTCKALSIFGRTQTVRVACAGYPKGVLPGVHSEGRHVAILFDDVRVDQLYQNRDFFRSGRPRCLSLKMSLTTGITSCRTTRWLIWYVPVTFQ